MTKEKNPGIAVLLSLLVPGLGQIYCEKIGRGILIIILAIFCWFILGFLFIPYLILWIYGMYDAYKIADATTKERKDNKTQESLSKNQEDKKYDGRGRRVLNSSVYLSESKQKSNSKIKMPAGIKPLKHISAILLPFLEHGEKILYEFIYDGGEEFKRGEAVDNSDSEMKVIFAATNKRLLKIRYFRGLDETVDEMPYNLISSVYLDNQYNKSYYQITMDANKTVMNRNILDRDEEEVTDTFKIKPIKWRILDVTNPEAKNLVAVIKMNMAGKKANTYTL